MKKNSKAVKIAKMLKAGNTVSYIKRMLGVSESYIYVVKKQMEAAAATAAEAETLTEAVKAKIGEFIQADTNVDAILNTRASTYGSFVDVARMAQRLKNVAHTAADEQGKSFSADQAEALDMIFSKLARIINGNADHIDSWVDIAGYAKLVSDRLEGKVR
jgi:hypothetical protein